MANQYGINYGEVLRDSEAIKNSRYGRKKSERQEARQVKQDARQDVLNQREDEEFAYGKQKRSKQDARQDVLNQRSDSAYESSQEQQQYNQQKAQLTEFGSMINYIEKAPIMMRQKAWDDVRGSLSPSGQENTPQQYDQDWLNLTKSRVQKQAQELTASDQLARDKFDETKRQSVIKNKSSERDFQYGKKQDQAKLEAEANKEIKPKGLKASDATALSREIAKDFTTGITEMPDGTKEYKFPSVEEKKKFNEILEIADDIFNKGGVSIIKAKQMAKRQHAEANKNKTPLTVDKLMEKYGQ